MCFASFCVQWSHSVARHWMIYWCKDVLYQELMRWFQISKHTDCYNCVLIFRLSKRTVIFLTINFLWKTFAVKKKKKKLRRRKCSLQKLLLYLLMSSVKGELILSVNPGRLYRNKFSVSETHTNSCILNDHDHKWDVYQEKVSSNLFRCGVCVLKPDKLAGLEIASQMVLGVAPSSSPLVRSSPCLSVASPNGCLEQGNGKAEFSSQEAARSDVRTALRMAESVTGRNWSGLIPRGAHGFQCLMDCLSATSCPWGEDDGGKVRLAGGVINCWRDDGNIKYAELNK